MLDNASKKVPIYTLGSVNSRSLVEVKVPVESYTSFTGTDLKCYLLRPIQKGGIKEYYQHFLKQREEGLTICLAEVQGYSFQADLITKTCHGDLLAIIFEKSLVEKLKPKNGLAFDLFIVGNTEFGNISAMLIKSIMPLSVSSGMATDDLVMEEKIIFQGGELIPWGVIQDSKEE